MNSQDQIKPFAEAMNDITQGVTDLTNNGKCTGCGACCSCFLPISTKELEKIKAYVDEHNIKAQRINFLAGPALDWTCPFMSKNKSTDRCLIYPVRPDVCKKFRCDIASKNKHWHHPNAKEIKVVNMRDLFQ